LGRKTISKDHWEDLDEDGTIILKTVLRGIGVGVDWINLAHHRNQ
jgi:hypothetical protein